MSEPRPDLTEFLEGMCQVDPTAEPRAFDRMMFDVCGEANHVRAAAERDPGALGDAIRAFDRSCERVYRDREVSAQRKWSLRTAEWVLKSWCLWGADDVSDKAATRFLDPGSARGTWPCSSCEARMLPLGSEVRPGRA